MMVGKTGANAEELRRQLDALESIAALLDQQPDEAIGAARRVATTVARLARESKRARLAAVAQRLGTATAGEFRPAFQELAACLRQAVDEATAPRGTVLIVEDDPLPAQLLGQALARKGWDVEVAGTGEAALKALATRSVSAVVLDLVLPDADGRNLLLRFKQDPASAAIPIYVASARSDPHVRAECLALGAEEFLPKPIEPERLIQLIAERASAPPAGLEHEATVSAGRSTLVNAFLRHEGGVCSLALIAASPTAPGGDRESDVGRADPLAPVAAIIAESAGPQSVVTRWAVDELAVLFPGVAIGDATRSLEAARAAGASGAGPDFVAGLVAVQANTDLDDAIDAAGRLLYLARGAPGGAIQTDPNAAGPRDITILVAEDDEVAAKLLVYRLSREPGFTVIHCGDGHDALLKAQQTSIDIAVLDVNMPGIDGFDLLERLREMPRYARLPIAMLTSLGSETDVVRGLELGADDYIVKPFSPTELIARVRRLLSRTAARS